jgi:hypothetical protein
MLMTFDAPDSNLCCVRRDRSNTPLQALTLLNDVVFVECAQGLAQRVISERSGPAQERIRYAFRLCLARNPSPPELAVLYNLFQQLLDSSKAYPDKAVQLLGGWKPVGMDRSEAAAWIALTRTLLNLDEFITKQ